MPLRRKWIRTSEFREDWESEFGRLVSSMLGNLTYFPKALVDRNVTYRVGNRFNEKHITKGA